ncbi:MAG: LysR family transcriptional regulator [Clostridia bacterium]|nr:LysR family transcriptional regulator [Clostridia bacterium]
MIDFELYRIFVVVAEEENITKASMKLNISQPAITKHIKSLEKQLSIKLFERLSKGVSLTEEGRRLYEKIKNPIGELNRVDEEMCKEVSINIGTHNHMGSCVFGDVINEYCLKYPDVNLNLICEETSEMIRKLKSKELDIVFSKKHSEDIKRT